MQLVSTLADGHCLFQAVRLSLFYQYHIDLQTSETLYALRHELVSKATEYVSFAFNSIKEYQLQLKHYLGQKINNSSSISDIAPLAISNSLSVRLNIVDNVTTAIHMRTTIQPQSVHSATKNFYIYWRSEYYSGVKIVHAVTLQTVAQEHNNAYVSPCRLSLLPPVVELATNQMCSPSPSASLDIKPDVALGLCHHLCCQLLPQNLHALSPSLVVNRPQKMTHLHGSDVYCIFSIYF